MAMVEPYARTIHLRNVLNFQCFLNNLLNNKNYLYSIALASIVSKIFEKLLYDRISYALTTCSNQFGFKTKHSTDMCMLLKKLY